jgi:hypothetical protein
MVMVLMTTAEKVSMMAAQLGMIEGCDDGSSLPTMDCWLSSEPTMRTKNLHCMQAGAGAFTATFKLIGIILFDNN